MLKNFFFNTFKNMRQDKFLLKVRNKFNDHSNFLDSISSGALFIEPIIISSYIEILINN